MKLWRLLNSSPTIWLTLDRVMQQLVWLVLFFILAPILGPKPYGLVAIVMAFIGLCETVLVGAFVESLISLRSVSDGHLGTANLLALIIAVAVGGLAFIAAVPIGTFFSSPELAPLFRALAPLPAISALTVTPAAVLFRHLRFRALALRSISGLLGGGIVAVILALNGAGVWALIAQVLTQRSIELAMLWASAHTRLGFSWSYSDFRDLRPYAISIGVSKGMTWLSGQIPRIILGWYLGPTELGFFALAGRLVDAIIKVFIAPRTTVARLMLRRFADEPSGLDEAFQTVIRQITIISFPICCGMAAIMPTLFAALLDSRWMTAIPAAQIMVITAIPVTTYYSFTAVVLALRKPHLDSFFSVATNASTALVVLIAAPHGLQFTCTAMLVQWTIMLPVALIMLRWQAGIAPTNVIWSQLPILGAAAIMGCIVVLSTPLMQSLFGNRLSLPVLIAIGIGTYMPLALLVAPDVVKGLLKSTFEARHPNAGTV